MGVLEGRIAIVTGAGQGLGRAHALRLAAEGATVVVNDVTDLADAVAAEAVAAGGRAVAHRCSVSEWAAVEAMVGDTVERFGDLNILVNNAGFLRDAMSFSMQEAQWDAVVDVHLKGHFVPCHFAAAYWRERAKQEQPVYGRIVNTASESGIFGGPAQANYSAAKGGIIALTLVLARELEKYGVTVNAIAPRARTSMTDANPRVAKPDEGFDKYDPANVAAVVAWLAGEGAADVSGQVICVIGSKLWHVPAMQFVNELDVGDRIWTLDELTAAKADLFGPGGPGVPPILAPRM